MSGYINANVNVNADDFLILFRVSAKINFLI